VPPTQLDDHEYCHRRAQELRDLAVQMSSDAAREQLVRMADEYDRLADLAAQRGKNVRANS
jgi:hypothetical protein